MESQQKLFFLDNSIAEIYLLWFSTKFLINSKIFSIKPIVSKYTYNKSKWPKSVLEFYAIKGQKDAFFFSKYLRLRKVYPKSL